MALSFGSQSQALLLKEIQQQARSLPAEDYAMPHPTDLSDDQWVRIQPLLPPLPLRSGRPRSLDLRAVFNALSYVVRTGCQWRNLPADLPPWSAVYYYYQLFSRTRTWPQMSEVLGGQPVRPALRLPGHSAMTSRS
jgi:transposase